MIDFNKCKEVKAGLMTSEEAERISNDFGMTKIEQDNYPLLVGKKALLKVNTNIGVSDESALKTELEKLEKISALSYRPDTMMDNTYIKLDKPLWKYMVDMFDGPIGTLPHYTAYSVGKEGGKGGRKEGIDANLFLETIDEMGAYGVKFMTLHLTANKRLLKIAEETRKIPTTSRGGSLILRDLILNGRQDNIIVDYLPEVLKLFRKYNMTLNIGTTFRPARIDEALDKVQIEEIQEQKKFIDTIKEYGVNVILEGVGHISLADVVKYCELINQNNAPLMPLGPIVTDASIGFDHVTAAIGASAISTYGNVGIINSVTREEHTGGVPTMDSIIEGLKTSRVVAHAVNILRFKKYAGIDRAISDSRATTRTCAIRGGIFDEDLVYSTKDGCRRCSYECPLNILKR